MMNEEIKKFPEQFSFEPRIENAEKLGVYSRYVVAGMGGSQHPAGLLMMTNPTLDIVQHRDYGLPHIPEEAIPHTLIIASSYSGNTEETIDAFRVARERGIPVAALAVGGKLLELAQQEGVPYIQLPDMHIQPRMGAGLIFRAFGALMREEAALTATMPLAQSLSAPVLEDEGKKLAQSLTDHVPIIYASRRNAILAYIWKINFNETGKIPAFSNALPELNHNEMNGFDVQDSSRALSENHAFLFLRDDTDHPRIIKRMDITERLYRDRELPVHTTLLVGKNQYEKIFSSLVLAAWTAYYIAEHYGLESEQVPMVEEFKRQMAQE